MTSLLRRLLGLGDRAARISYEEAREMAQHNDPKVRATLAARTDLRPELLYFLAEDPVTAVRLTIAGNSASPAQANLLLAGDTDEEVRAVLAQKVALLAPGLSADDQDRLRRMTYQALVLLARDQITRVRAILAEALKDVANAPPEVIRQLARDAEMAVAAPVLEHSPVLTDQDLLEIIESGPVQGALSAISRRSQVRALVADAIAASDDVEAIAHLLANSSAQIREETLDRLIDRAPDIEGWHGPLVRRPQLSSRAAARLAHFVAENLLQVLQSREDMDADTAAAVGAAVRRRLAQEDPRVGPGGRSDSVPVAVRVNPDEKAIEAARRMRDLGALDESLICEAIQSQDTEFVLAAVAVRADVPISLVRLVVATHSAKGSVALAWRSGLSMTFAVSFQTLVAHVPAADTIRPKAGALYPLTAEEMRTYLDVLGLKGAKI